MMWRDPGRTFWLLGGLGVLAFLTSLVLVGAIKMLAERWTILDLPNERSSHSVPTPRGGGAGVVLVLLGAVAGLGGSGIISNTATWGIGASLLAVAVVGAVDDIKSFSPTLRLGAHLAASVIAVAAIGPVESVKVGAIEWPLGPLAAPTSVLLLMWWINLTNFMDGIDGVAGTQVAVVASATAVAAWQGATTDVFAWAVAITAATLGFLRWNWPPARIFMGDVGSGSLGLALALLALLADHRGVLPLAGSALLYGVFVTDATLTLMRRVMNGQKPWEAHRTHLYQRLAPRPSDHRRVVIGITLTSVGLAAGVLYTLHAPRHALTVYCVLAATLVGAFAWGLRVR